MFASSHFCKLLSCYCCLPKTDIFGHYFICFLFLFWSKGKRKPEKNFWVYTGKRKSCWKARVLKVEWDRAWKQVRRDFFFFFRFSYCKSTFSVPLQIVILAFPEQILNFPFLYGYKAYFSTLWLWIFLQLVEPLPVQWSCANSILEPDKESTTSISICSLLFQFKSIWGTEILSAFNSATQRTSLQRLGENTTRNLVFWLNKMLAESSKYHLNWDSKGITD